MTARTRRRTAGIAATACALALGGAAPAVLAANPAPSITINVEYDGSVLVFACTAKSNQLAPMLTAVTSCADSTGNQAPPVTAPGAVAATAGTGVPPVEGSSSVCATAYSIDANGVRSPEGSRCVSVWSGLVAGGGLLDRLK